MSGVGYGGQAVLVLVLESGHAERWSAGVLEYCAKSELHPPRRIGDAEGAAEIR